MSKFINKQPSKSIEELRAILDTEFRYSHELTKKELEKTGLFLSKTDRVYIDGEWFYIYGNGFAENTPEEFFVELITEEGELTFCEDELGVIWMEVNNEIY